MQPKVREIGSEFWDNGPSCRDKIYVLSGRTALEYIIDDIQRSNRIRCAYLPSYCCHTMIEPFVRHGILVKFYDVFYDDTHGLSIDVPELCARDIFYYMTYFGFERLYGLDPASISKTGCITIEDKTHSWLIPQRFYVADYNYTSYRKWTGFTAVAMAQKKQGRFHDKPEKTNDSYSEIRRRAFSLKSAYINGEIGNKQDFLELFARAEKLLEEAYVGYKASNESLAALLSLDTEEMAKRRRENTSILTEGLSTVNGIELMFPYADNEDVPLFVPVLVKDNRDDLRQYLIQRSIYCPVHWPLSMYHNGLSDRARAVYTHELSLVCDQRYGADEMDRIVNCIKQYYEG